MGSFSVACGVSRMALGHGDKCLLIPLARTKHSDDCKSGSYYVSNDGPIGRFHPLTLPIFGEYNDYGSLENIEETANTKRIEEFFGCSISDFVEHMCYQYNSPLEKDAGPNVPKEGYGMFVKREVFDDLANNPMSEWGKKETAFNSFDMNVFTLNYLGFVEDTTIKKDTKERFNRLFKHEEIPQFEAWSDGNWTHYKLNGKDYEHIYHPDGLYKLLKQKRILVSVDKFEKLKTIRTAEMWYDSEREKIKKITEKEKVFANPPTEGESKQVTAKKLLELAMAMSDFEYSHDIHFLKLGNWSNNNKRFRELYESLFDDKTFRKEFIDYKTFEQGLYFINAPLMPSWCGIQYGCHDAELRLAKLVQKLAKKKIKQYSGE